VTTRGRAPGTPAWNKGRKLPAEPLSRAEANALMRACSLTSATGIRNRALIMVMYRCGLRVDEALKLRVSDIDMSTGSVRVLHGKGDQARTVALDPGAQAVVQLWGDARKSLGLGRGLLFCTLGGTRMSPQYTGQMIRRAAAKADIDKRVHPHGLRHTMAQELADEDTSLVDIRDALGHSSLAVTDRYLRRLAPQRVKKAMRARVWTDETEGTAR
jgi:site-specific recombinase XerD